jgi:hypothetical protein
MHRKEVCSKEGEFNMQEGFAGATSNAYKRGNCCMFATVR